MAALSTASFIPSSPRLSRPASRKSTSTWHPSQRLESTCDQFAAATPESSSLPAASPNYQTLPTLPSRASSLWNPTNPCQTPSRPRSALLLSLPALPRATRASARGSATRLFGCCPVLPHVPSPLPLPSSRLHPRHPAGTVRPAKGHPRLRFQRAPVPANRLPPCRQTLLLESSAGPPSHPRSHPSLAGDPSASQSQRLLSRHCLLLLAKSPTRPSPIFRWSTAPSWQDLPSSTLAPGPLLLLSGAV